MGLLVDIRGSRALSRAVHRESISWTAASPHIVSRFVVWHRVHACAHTCYARVCTHACTQSRTCVRSAREPGLASKIYRFLLYLSMRVLSTAWNIRTRQNVVRDFTAITMGTPPFVSPRRERLWYLSPQSLFPCRRKWIVL